MSGNLIYHFISNLLTPYPIGKLDVADYLNRFRQNQPASSIADNTITENPAFDLTVIVPVYNVDKYLKECIDSILNQRTRYKIKIVAVNDGSTDNSGQILKEYSDNPGLCIINQENKGLSAARNAALEEIDSRYIMFVDSDDTLGGENCLETMIQTADRLGADVVQGSWSRFSEQGALGDNIYRYSENAGAIAGYAWGKIFRSSIWRRFHFPEGYWFEDALIGMVISSMCHKMVTIPEIVYRYRINPSGLNISSRKDHRALDTLYITEALVRDRMSLGMRMDEKDLGLFLHQVRLNIHRILGFRDRRLQRCMYEVHRRIYLDAYTHLKSTGLRNRMLENAFRKNSYFKYILATL